MHIWFSFLQLHAIFCLKRIPILEHELHSLRQEISNQLLYKDPDVDLIHESLILDNKCGMLNTEGVCYFNAVIQSLFANRHFLLFYIMNDFTYDQPLSSVLQELAVKMLRHKNIDPLPFLSRFSEHQRLLNHCTLNGGNPLVLLEELLIGLYSEIEGVDDLYHLEGAPQNYFLTEKFTTTCKKCMKRTVDEISSVTINVPFSDTLEESLAFYKNVKKASNANKYYKCTHCKKFSPIIPSDIKLETEYPEHLILAFERVQIKNNIIYSIFQEMEMHKHIIIDGNKYELYSAICSFMLKKGYHANAIVKKNGNWVLYNDNQLEIFPENYTDATIFNNFAWVLFLRKVSV